MEPSTHPSDKSTKTENSEQEHDNSPNPQKAHDFSKLHRIVTVDFARGLGLFVVLIIHLYNFWGMEYFIGNKEQNLDLTNQPWWVTALTMPFIILASWASVFAMLTGASTAFIMHYQITEKHVNIWRRLKKSLINVGLLLLINFLYIYLFIYPSRNILGKEYRGLIPASIREGKWIIPDKEIFFMASPLSLIAFSNLFIVIICAIMWRKGVKKREVNAYYLAFGILGGFIVLFARPLSNLLLPIMEEQHAQGHYFNTLFISWLVGPKLSIFPFVGFSFFGAMIGFYLREGQRDRRKLNIMGYSIAGTSFGIAAVDSLINGFPSLEEIYGLYFPFIIYMLNLSLQTFLATFFIKFFDFIPLPERKSHRRFRKIILFQRMSIISLTLFMFEEVTSAIYTRLTLAIYSGLLTNLYLLMFVWGPLYVFLWSVLVNKWEKKARFKYSIEWFLTCLLKLKNITTDEDLLLTEKIIYLPMGYKSREEYFIEKERRKAAKKKKL